MIDSAGELSSISAGRDISETRIQAETVRIGTLVAKALKGELPRDRELHVGEAQILTPLHINIILDRVAGYTNVELAEKWGVTAATVLNVLGHPDAQVLISSMLAVQATGLVSMEDRFKVLAPEALNTKVALMRDEATPAAVKDRVASDILDRAGYAPKKREEHTHKHQILMPAQAATGLRQVLEESNRISAVDYSGFLRRPGAEAAAASLQIEAGQPESVGGASPTTAPDAREFHDETSSPNAEVAA